MRLCCAPNAIVHGPRHGAYFSGGGLLQPHLDCASGALAGVCALRIGSAVHDGISVKIRPSTPDLQISMEAGESWHGANDEETVLSHPRRRWNLCIIKSAVA